MTPPPPTLMLVDDEAEILVALSDLFEDEYRILSFTSPLAALAALGDAPDVAVIVSDQRMPEMPGNQFLSRARVTCDAEAILLTGYADLSAVVSAVNDGAISGYANKPWEPEALRATVASAAARHALRRALAFEQAAFRGLADNGPDKVVVLGAEGQVLRANAAASAAGFAAEAEDLAAMADDAAGDEERREGKGDDERWQRIRRVPFRVGDARHLLRIEGDDTARRHAARRRHQSEKLEALGTLAGGIAHDFNNLLAAIIGNLELAGRAAGGDPDRLARFLRNANEAAGRGSAITRRLLSFSRQRDLAAGTFDPATAIRGIEELIVRGAAGRVALRFDFADDGWPVHTDPGQFELAVVNLCINARDAMGGDGTIAVATRNIADPTTLPEGCSGDHVRITVADTGTGMSDAVRARVFEPFFTTKAQGVGTGLGLPMVRAMAEAAGGTITIDSTLGQGTAIHLWLPRAEAAEEAAPPPAAEAGQSPLAILVAEDDAEVRGVLVEHLRDAGHQVIAADAAEPALAVLETGAPVDLLLTDHAMPRMSGVALAKRARGLRPALPVLLVTGFAELADARNGLPVLTKPFTAQQLRHAIAAAVSKTEQG